MVPGRRPFEELEAALVVALPDLSPHPLGRPDEPDDGLLRAARAVLPLDAELLLVIDQFEDLFSTADENQRRRFVRCLVAAASVPQERIRVVLTLRADFYDRPLLDTAFGPIFTRSVVNAHAMTVTELEEAVLRPARLVGVDVDPGLLAELISVTASQPGALPLLQYALTELFDRRAGAGLTVDEYRGLGGLHGLLSRSSEELYRRMDPEHQRVTLQVFLRMIRLDQRTEASRRRVPVGELTALDIDPVLLSEVLEAFGRHRLLTFDRDAVTGDGTVEVAHDALLTEWDRFAGWIEGHRSDLRRHAALVAAVEDWETSDRAPDYLYTGARLIDVEAWADGTALQLTVTERAFIDASLHRRASEKEIEAVASQRQRRLERRARTRLVALAAAVAMLVGAVTYGLLAWPDDDPLDAALLGGNPPIFREMLVAGFDEAASELGIRADTVEPDGPAVSPEQVEAYSENGTGLVVALSTCDTVGKVVEPTARAHPETSYVVFDCPGEEPNVAYVTFAAEQGSFLAGRRRRSSPEPASSGSSAAPTYRSSGSSRPGSRRGRAP